MRGESKNVQNNCRLDLGTGFTKQRNKTFKIIFCFIVEQKYLTNRKGEKLCFSLPIGQHKIVHQENKIIFCVLSHVMWFSCFVNLSPEEI